MTELTPAQVELKVKIRRLRKYATWVNHLLRKIKSECTHVMTRRSQSAYCDICGDYFGLWCTSSEGHVCVFSYLTHNDYCVHCGQPEERK